MLAGVLFLLFGAACYFATGQPPIICRVLRIQPLAACRTAGEAYNRGVRPEP